jgi:CDP-paratose 2-epimerase
MRVAIITGAAGLIGADACRLFAAKGFTVVGIDNDMRSYFFGESASTKWCRLQLQENIDGYIHINEDIRDENAMGKLFSDYGNDIEVVIHAAAQPSHDWAAKEPFTDFSINANGTLVLLEKFKNYCPKASFIFMSTNKVYGDTPNALPMIETDTRWELESDHVYAEFGIDETMSIDQSKHSLFGASKISADIMVQEYGRYFGLNTVCLRGGCLTGPGHSGAKLHGFLSYLMKCAITGDHYTVFGHKGKQVRDNIHSADLVSMFWHYHQRPRGGEVYNAGGGRFANCSMQEAIAMCEGITGNKMSWSYDEDNRSGDHIWWISDTRKFQHHYPEWKYTMDIEQTLEDIHREFVGRLPANKLVSA